MKVKDIKRGLNQHGSYLKQMGGLGLGISATAGRHTLIAWFSFVPAHLQWWLMQSPYLGWVPRTMDTAVQHWQSEEQNDLSSSLSMAAPTSRNGNGGGWISGFLISNSSEGNWNGLITCWLNCFPLARLSEHMQRGQWPLWTPDHLRSWKELSQFSVFLITVFLKI